ncbi:MAG TPA: hypothetical protein VL634_20575 [Mycobacterium sp.]|nr:hypothetical protein [Mycobacterium sp.]
MNKHTLRLAAGLLGASAAITMGALSAGATQAQPNTAVPEHFGGPVYTSVYDPPASLGMPTLSSSATASPAPMNASS